MKRRMLELSLMRMKLSRRLNLYLSSLLRSSNIMVLFLLSMEGAKVDLEGSEERNTNASEAESNSKYTEEQMENQVQ